MEPLLADAGEWFAAPRYAATLITVNADDSRESPA
jgi:hypothetical protein